MVSKVITINLRGKAYQLEEAGYDALKKYFDQASLALKHDPDKDEIILDLEQGVAEKCDHYVSSAKNVVLAGEMEKIIEEMGPVKDIDESSGEQSQTQSQETPKGVPKRLYRIAEGAIFGGVCNGLAAYFNIDVTLVRLIFIVLTLVSGGAWVAAYIVMIIIVPRADTPEKVAAASGAPFTAEDFVNRAKAEFASFKSRKQWHEELRRNRKEWKEKFRQTIRENRVKWRDHASYDANAGKTSCPPLFWPFFWLLRIAFLVVFVFALISLVATGAVFGFLVPQSFPLWLAVVTLIIVYMIFTMPFRAMRWHYRHNGSHYICHRHSFFESLFWVAFIVLAVWLLYTYVPQAHDTINRLPDAWNNFLSTRIH